MGRWLGDGGEVAQMIYTHVSKCKNKIKKIILLSTSLQFYHESVLIRVIVQII
jgi:hypothetical protein